MTQTTPPEGEADARLDTEFASATCENRPILIDDISRLARGLDAHLALRTAISEAGGVLESPSIEFGEDSDSQLIEHLLASVSAHAGMIERPEWDVSLRKAKHEGLISFETYERIQERLKTRAYAPTRKDLHEDFPLRGAVECAECGHPMTSCWSKSKTGARHPYYMCFQKGCGSYRKSIRRSEMEGQLEALLQGMTPAKALLDMIRAMFTDAWAMRQAQADQAAKAIARGIAQIETNIAAVLDRIIDASSATAGRAISPPRRRRWAP